MAKLIARIVSVLLHPLIMPVYGLLVIFQTNGDVMLQIPFQAKRVLLAVVAINTLVLPILVLPVFRKMNIIKSLQMESHRERILPILFTLIPYIFSFYFLMRLPILSEISLFMLGATLAVLAALVISIWWKISIHMIGIGGLVGLTLALTYNIQYSELPYLILSIMLSGIVAWARLHLNTHSPSQVYAGFGIGVTLVSISIIMF
ncbi:MAG: hypothetical protein WC951_00240 [Bacteroidales bacterium]|nr:hypothetical protein [Tenuifilaceae bacterium]